MEAGEALADQPGPRVRPRKKLRDDLIAEAAAGPGWVLGFQDECWWTRLAQPTLSSWTAGGPVRLAANARDPAGGGPEAVACYGVLRADTGGMMLRSCDGRPVSATTEEFLGWVCERLAAEGKTVFVLVWDNAAWHVSERVAAWVEAHNETVARDGGCRVVECRLPVEAPWLNRIEPKWVHGKKAVAGPGRKLSADEVRQRVCDYYGCQPGPTLAKPPA